LDDRPHSIRELVGVFLAIAAFDVYEAGDGRQALARLDRVKAGPGDPGW